MTGEGLRTPIFKMYRGSSDPEHEVKGRPRSHPGE